MAKGMGGKMFLFKPLRLHCAIAFYIICSCASANAHECNAGLEYKVEKLDDGGYKLSITCTVQLMKMITAEGFFPNKTTNFLISLVGSGKDWSYRNQNGFFYSIENIVSKNNAWDWGYVWVDSMREYIYLNFYWISSPDELHPSIINGKYKIIN